MFAFDPRNGIQSMPRTQTFLLMLVAAIAGSAVTLLAGQNQQATYRIPMFENDQVKVWKTVILPNSPLSMHRHEHGRALVAVKGGTVTIQQENGSKRLVEWKSGQAYWLDADPPGSATHADINETRSPIEVIVMELKRDK